MQIRELHFYFPTPYMMISDLFKMLLAYAKRMSKPLDFDEKALVT